jgi:hypothetical protein
MPKEPEKLPEAFKKHIVEAGLVNPAYSDVFDKVVSMKKMLDEKNIEKINEREVYVNKEYIRRFIEDLRKAMDKPIDIEPKEETKAEKKTKRKK